MNNAIKTYSGAGVTIENIKADSENNTVWLTQKQIAELYGVDRTVITKHINNIFETEELEEKVVCSFFAHTTQHGSIAGKFQTHQVLHYNLDMILSVGYKVNSKQATKFRQWSNEILKREILGTTKPEKPKHRLETFVMIRNRVNTDQIPFNYFCVITEASLFIDRLEQDLYKQGVEFPENMRPEISVGKLWIKHARNVLKINVDALPKYIHTDTRSGVKFEACMYPQEYKTVFSQWLSDIYLKKFLIKYITASKYTKENEVIQELCCDFANNMLQMMGDDLRVSLTIKRLDK